MQGLPFRVDGQGRVLVSWMSRDRVFWAWSDEGTRRFGRKVATPDGGTAKQAYPVVLANARGEVLFMWKEGAQVTWAVYARDGKPTRLRGHAGRVPGGHKPTAVVNPDGSFAIVF